MAKKQHVSFPSGIVSDEMASLATEIQDLARVRAALSFGTKTGPRDSAESTISRKINAKVNDLSKLVLQDYGE